MSDSTYTYNRAVLEKDGHHFCFVWGFPVSLSNDAPEVSEFVEVSHSAYTTDEILGMPRQCMPRQYSRYQARKIWIDLIVRGYHRVQ